MGRPRRDRDSLDAQVHKGIKLMQERNKGLNSLEQFAKQYPIIATRLFVHTTLDQTRVLRRYLRTRFGIKVWETPAGRPETQTINRERARPRTRREVVLQMETLYNWFFWIHAWRALVIVMRKAQSEGGSPCIDACATFIALLRERPLWYATTTRKGEGPPPQKDIQQAAIALLSSWVGSQVSFYRNKRLENALSKDGKPFEELIKNLPEATLDELHKLRPGTPPHKQLLNQVTEHIVSQIRHTAGPAEQSTNASLNEIPDEDSGIEKDSRLLKWAAEEEESHLLNGLVNQAKLSTQQNEIINLVRQEEGLLNNNNDIAAKEVAARLGLTANQVSVQWGRIRKTMLRASGE